MAGGMSNPFEFREVMKAAFRFGESRTVDEVVAAQEARQKAQRAEAASAERRKRATPTSVTNEPPPPAPMSTVPKSAVDELRALMAQAAAVQSESTSIPER